MKPKFKVGDQVIVKGLKGMWGTSLNGKKGVVQNTFVIGNYRQYTVKLENTAVNTIEISARELDKVEVKESRTAVKVGDKVVITIPHGHYSFLNGRNGVILAVRNFTCDNQFMYVVQVEHCAVFNFYANEFVLAKNENKPTRSISLTLEQAKEYYKTGGELRKIALQVFTEEELNPKPKYPLTWNEYRKNHASFEVTIPESEVLQNQVLAFTALLLLRKEWIHIWSQAQGLEKDWEPDWSCKQYYTRWCIEDSSEGLSVVQYRNIYHTFNFPTMEMANKFLNCFDYLLEQAKGLY